MQQALGLSGTTAIMVAIALALGVAGILALAMALFWPRRWRLRYRMEIGFVVLLLGLVIYGDFTSGRTYQAYEATLPAPAALSGPKRFDAKGAGFDREVRVYTLMVMLMTPGAPMDMAAMGQGGKPAAAGPFEGTGTVVAVDPESREIVLDHEAVEGLMGAMTMGYALASEDLLKGLNPGDTVKFKIDSAKQAVVAIERLK